MTGGSEGDVCGARSAATLLQPIWLASPALPVGGFSYSEGLEAAVEAGCVATEGDVAGWLGDQLHLTLARAELPAMLGALAAWHADDRSAVIELNDWMHHTREAAESRRQTEQMGRSLAEWLRHGGSIADTVPAGAPDPRDAGRRRARLRLRLGREPGAGGDALGAARPKRGAAPARPAGGGDAGRRRRCAGAGGRPRCGRAAAGTRADAGGAVGTARDAIFAAVPLPNQVSSPGQAR